MLKKIRAECAGKINLALNILGADGLHYIDSVMQSVSICDAVTVAERRDDKLNIRFIGTDAVGENNTVKKTAEYYRDKFGAFGADIVVEKNLPLGGGMGGSSADAAALIVALDEMYGFSARGADRFEVAAAIGSDVAFMLGGGCARVGGFGEKITPIENRAKMFMVAAYAGIPLDSGEVYAEFDRLNPDKRLIVSDVDKLRDSLERGEASGFGNALTAAAESLCGKISLTAEALRTAGAKTAVMTGSGSTVIGFFEDGEGARAAAYSLRIRGYYARFCVNLPCGVRLY